MNGASFRPSASAAAIRPLSIFTSRFHGPFPRRLVIGMTPEFAISRPTPSTDPTLSSSRSRPRRSGCWCRRYIDAKNAVMGFEKSMDGARMQTADQAGFVGMKAKSGSGRP